MALSKPGVLALGVLVLGTLQPLTAAPLAIRVVAAENIYGDLVSQIGGSQAEVFSVIADPNVDPHEYESNVLVARKVSDADLVVENGGGYDDWMDKLLEASRNPGRTVVKAFDLAPVKLKENEHVWYNPDNVLAVSQKILEILKARDPGSAAVFETNFTGLKTGLLGVRNRLAALGTRFAKTPVALTETLFLYQSTLMGLDVVTPWNFQKAIAEGNDPAPADTVTAERQLADRQARVLIYNLQTSTPLTTRLLNKAKALGIPVVGVTETMPAAGHYQSWMGAQLDALEAALNRK